MPPSLPWGRAGRLSQRGKALGLVRTRQLAQDTLEYGLLIATIAIVVLVGISAFGYLIQPWFISLASRVTTVGP